MDYLLALSEDGCSPQFIREGKGKGNLHKGLWGSQIS
jgi:hypothetical protein